MIATPHQINVFFSSPYQNHPMSISRSCETMSIDQFHEDNKNNITSVRNSRKFLNYFCPIVIKVI